MEIPIYASVDVHPSQTLTDGALDPRSWTHVGSVDTSVAPGELTVALKPYLNHGGAARGASFFLDLDPSTAFADELRALTPAIEGPIGPRKKGAFWIALDLTKHFGKFLVSTQRIDLDPIAKIRRPSPHPGLTVQPLRVGVRLVKPSNGEPFVTLAV